MNIALCGYMGSGKSSVGKSLAFKLGYEYIDTDEYIEKSFGMSIPKIFDTIGEAGFRSAETEALMHLSNRKRTVFSLGGGSLISPENRDILLKYATIVYLEVPFETCYNRICEGADRPIVNAKTKEELLQHYNQRLAIYEQSADYRVNGSGSISTTVDNILRLSIARN